VQWITSTSCADTHSTPVFGVIDRLELGRESLEQAFDACHSRRGGNRDEHTKNLGFVCQPTEWALAPAYDVKSLLQSRRLWTQRHQMSVNAKFEHITRGDLLEWLNDSTCRGALGSWTWTQR